VIELSGVAAKSLRVPVDREQFRQERIQIICQRMVTSRPAFVVMYGVSERPYWEEIAGCALVRDGVVKVGSTMIAFAPHPPRSRAAGRRLDEVGRDATPGIRSFMKFRSAK
jgi:hypothetical protein